MTLCGNRAFEDVIRFRWLGWSSWCPHRKRKQIQGEKTQKRTDTELKEQVKDKGRDWRYAAINQGMSVATRSWKTQERILFYVLDFRLPASKTKKINYVAWSHLVLVLCNGSPWIPTYFFPHSFSEFFLHARHYTGHCAGNEVHFLRVCRRPFPKITCSCCSLSQEGLSPRLTGRFPVAAWVPRRMPASLSSSPDPPRWTV